MKKYTIVGQYDDFGNEIKKSYLTNSSDEAITQFKKDVQPMINLAQWLYLKNRISVLDRKLVLGWFQKLSN